jgi:hypothetical protein
MLENVHEEIASCGSAVMMVRPGLRRAASSTTF